MADWEDENRLYNRPGLTLPPPPLPHQTRANSGASVGARTKTHSFKLQSTWKITSNPPLTFYRIDNRVLSVAILYFIHAFSTRPNQSCDAPPNPKPNNRKHAFFNKTFAEHKSTLIIIPPSIVCHTWPVVTQRVFAPQQFHCFAHTLNQCWGLAICFLDIYKFDLLNVGWKFGQRTAFPPRTPCPGFLFGVEPWARFSVVISNDDNSLEHYF